MGEKETLAYKDVFFLNDPKMSKVPRRHDRQHFYDCGLVGSAVTFTSSMEEREMCSNGSIFVHFWELRRSPEVGVSLFLQ